MGITARGYSRLYDAASKRLRMEHDLVWERTHGPIPAGFDIHHINHDKLDNRIENLELLDRIAHKRLHGGCEQRDGMWWKPCRKCRTMKPVTEYYAQSRRILSWCKSCQIANAVRNKRRRHAVIERQWPLPAERDSRIVAAKDAANALDGRNQCEIAGQRQPAAA